MKIQQNEKSATKLNEKAGRQIRKNKPKMSKFYKNTPNMPSAVNRNSKSAIKFEKRAIGKNISPNSRENRKVGNTDNDQKN